MQKTIAAIILGALLAGCTPPAPSPTATSTSGALAPVATTGVEKKTV